MHLRLASKCPFRPSFGGKPTHSAATHGLRAIVAGLPDAAEEDIDQSQVSWNMGAGIARAASPAMKR